MRTMTVQVLLQTCLAVGVGPSPTLLLHAVGSKAQLRVHEKRLSLVNRARWHVKRFHSDGCKKAVWLQSRGQRHIWPHRCLRYKGKPAQWHTTIVNAMEAVIPSTPSPLLACRMKRCGAAHIKRQQEFMELVAKNILWT